MMDIFHNPSALDRYLEAHSSPEDPVLAELARHTFLKVVHPRMLSGHILGSFLKIFSTLVSPKRILEIGTYTGYSAICLASGLREGGKLITLEVNEELRETAQLFFRKAGLADRIELINGNALGILPSLEGPFDLLFIDANKEDYSTYYDLAIGKMAPGSFILADNVLWGGKVLDPDIQDTSTRAIQNFNDLVTGDPRVETLLLPIRDGLMIMRKT